MTTESIASVPRARSVAELLFTLTALSEIVVGALVLALPVTLTRLLLGSAVEGVAVVAVRMLGIAVAALGIAWCVDSKRLDSRVASGFIAYNLGVGVLFLAHALSAVQVLAWCWLVAVVHLAVGSVFVAFVALRALGTR